MNAQKDQMRAMAETLSPWKGQGRGADPAAVAAALVSLLLGYLDTALPSSNESHAEMSSAATMQAWCYLTACVERLDLS